MIEIADITAVSDLKIFWLILIGWTPLKDRMFSLSDSEREKILNFKGVQALKINDNILRTETAVISTISIINYAINW